MTNAYQKAEAARYFLQNIIGEGRINAAMITGTGLGDVWKELDITHTIPYEDIPHFPISTVQGHAGRLYIGKYKDFLIAVFSGRFHYYEGYDASEIAFPVRVIKALGVENIIISNAAGGVNEAYEQGDIIMVRDHINRQPVNPLRGPNEYRWGSRFPDFMNVYDADLRGRLMKVAANNHIKLQEGVYFSWQGPNLETPAEYQFIHDCGADLVGMSTVPEVIAASHMNMNIVVFSLVSNVCYPLDRIRETSAEDVVEAGKRAAPIMSRLSLLTVEEMCA